VEGSGWNWQRIARAGEYWRRASPKNKKTIAGDDQDERMVQQQDMKWTAGCQQIDFSLFLSQPLSVHGWTLIFLLDFHRLCGVIEGRLSHFLPRWLRTGWQSAINQEKIP